MELSAASLWQWTKLFVRDPRLAAELVREAKLPLEVSIMMIVLAGVLWSVLSGFFIVLVGSPSIYLPVSETEAMVVQPAGPVAIGLFAVLVGTSLGYAIFQTGRRASGRGSMAEIMSITAVLELVVLIIIVAQFLVGIILPGVGLILFFAALFVLFRGLGHVVNVGHRYDDMGKSAMVLVGAFVLMTFMILTVFIILAMLGITGPEGEIVPIPLGETL